MIVTDRFVFLHLHKSGGTFVLKFLQEFEPSARMIGYHLPYSALPGEFRDLPVLGTVRNPWSYYVSWFAFQSGMASPNALFRLVSDDCRLDFAGTIRNLVTLAESPQRLAALQQALPHNFRPRGLNLTRSCVDPLRGSGQGFYTFMFERMYSGCERPRIVRMESLRDDLPGALGDVGKELTPAELAFFATAPATNTTDHAPFQEYYDRDLRDLVRERDSAVIDGFNYAFD
jgi:hypothetical protein